MAEEGSGPCGEEGASGKGEQCFDVVVKEEVKATDVVAQDAEDFTWLGKAMVSMNVRKLIVSNCRESAGPEFTGPELEDLEGPEFEGFCEMFHGESMDELILKRTRRLHNCHPRDGVTIPSGAGGEGDVPAACSPRLCTHFGGELKLENESGSIADEVGRAHTVTCGHLAHGHACHEVVASCEDEIFDVGDAGMVLMDCVHAHHTCGEAEVVGDDRDRSAKQSVECWHVHRIRRITGPAGDALGAAPTLNFLQPNKRRKLDPEASESREGVAAPTTSFSPPTYPGGLVHPAQVQSGDEAVTRSIVEFSPKISRKFSSLMSPVAHISDDSVFDVMRCPITYVKFKSKLTPQAGAALFKAIENCMAEMAQAGPQEGALLSENTMPVEGARAASGEVTPSSGEAQAVVKVGDELSQPKFDLAKALRDDGNRAAVRRYREKKKALDAQRDAEVTQLKTENMMMRAENVQIRHSLTMCFSSIGNYPGLAMMMADSSAKAVQGPFSGVGYPQLPMPPGMDTHPGNALGHFDPNSNVVRHPVSNALFGSAGQGSAENSLISAVQARIRAMENVPVYNPEPGPRERNGNREAVRRYREKKKAMDALRDAEVNQLKAENMMMRAENVQLRHSLNMWLSAKELYSSGHAVQGGTSAGKPLPPGSTPTQSAGFHAGLLPGSSPNFGGGVGLGLPTPPGLPMPTGLPMHAGMPMHPGLPMHPGMPMHPGFPMHPGLPVHPGVQSQDQQLTALLMQQQHLHQQMQHQQMQLYRLGG